MKVLTLPDQRWGTTVVMLAVLSIGAVCLVNGARRIGRPFPGFLVSVNHIVLSIGRRGWSGEKAERIRFAKVIAIEGHPITTATDVEAYVATLPVGTPVTYRFRKQADVFTTTVEVNLFDLSDFLALYTTYFATGVCFALAGWWVLRRCRTSLPAAPAFFVLCQTIGAAVVAGGDVYGPYWFTSLYFTAHCLTFAALVHFASRFPEPLGIARYWQALAIAVLYIGSIVIAFLLNRTANDPSLFLPLIYTVYLLVANAALLYVGRLAIAAWTVTDPRLRRSVRRALVAVLLSATVPGVIWVTYPALKQPISPIVLIAPLVIFPFFTASALYHAPQAGLSPSGTSVRRRLSLLFLGAVETAFLAAIAVFWLSNSWQQLIDDLALNQRQQAVLARFLHPTSPVSGDDLTAIDALVQTVPERTLVAAAHAAMSRGNISGAREVMEQLGSRYHTAEARLGRRRRRLGRLETGLVLSLVGIGLVQAVGFMIAIRRWLIRPVDQLAVATNIIATGNLSHRISPDAEGEFRTLADAINTMAASLAQIQARIDAEQHARRRAAGAARDAERRRLTRELHDGTLQDLSAVKLRLEGAVRNTPSAELQAAVDAIIEIIVALRRVLDDLGAPDVSHISLREAIAAYAQALADGHGVALQLDLGTSQVPEWATRDAYRIAQEALTNAVRHGAPARLRVQLRDTSDHMLLEIVDDGAGFDVGSAVLGSGIRSMRERAAAIGATLDVSAAPGHGTRVRLTLPHAPARP